MTTSSSYTGFKMLFLRLIPTISMASKKCITLKTLMFSSLNQSNSSIPKQKRLPINFQSFKQLLACIKILVSTRSTDANSIITEEHYHHFCRSVITYRTLQRKIFKEVLVRCVQNRSQQHCLLGARLYILGFLDHTIC